MDFRCVFFFFFQAEDGIRDSSVTGVQTCALPICTAFAWESLIDEAVFILGPPLATIVALQIAPSAALILATTLLIIGTLLLLTQKSTEPKPSGRHNAAKGRPAILLPGVGGISAIFVMLGGIFGSFEVTTVAFSKEAG